MDVDSDQQNCPPWALEIWEYTRDSYEGRAGLAVAVQGSITKTPPSPPPPPTPTLPTPPLPSSFFYSSFKPGR